MRTIESTTTSSLHSRLKNRLSDLLRVIGNGGGKQKMARAYRNIADLAPQQLNDIVGQDEAINLQSCSVRQDRALQDAKQRAMLLALGTGGR